MKFFEALPCSYIEHCGVCGFIVALSKKIPSKVIM